MSDQRLHRPLTVSWVVLTMGDRPTELASAITSIRGQHKGDDAEIVLVVNGTGTEGDRPSRPAGHAGVGAGVNEVVLETNVGIPGGRNVGIEHSHGDLIFFLDDDAEVADPGLVEAVQYLFATEPGLGIVTFRLVDPDSGETERRHVPRIRVGDPARSSTVTTFLGGACCVRREVFDEVGSYAANFFYAMEESDLAWRALDAGWRLLYLGDQHVLHPASSPARHAMSARLTSRNRVWLVRRRLPVPLAATYLGVWAALTVSRDRSVERLRAAGAGVWEGFRSPAGQRAPMSWRTAAKMTAAGRPPII